MKTLYIIMYILYCAVNKYIFFLYVPNKYTKDKMKIFVAALMQSKSLFLLTVF
ncbi:hypothetical protein C1645_779686 [Glomus cerebriforme]|uniref:Uncharacterized protein n=1 Tax=Glomus cerebriforme TaxID=658196 RepID=A0A397SK55_9GLOM|nr:hypothetical protein C1645_779686 [Glomus cerebriforme]